MSVVAARRYHIKAGDGKVRHVDVELTAVEPKPDDEEFTVFYEMRGLGSGTIRGKAVGIDSIQSIQLAEIAIRAHIEGSTEYKDRQLFWLEEGDTDLGLRSPTP